jgi:hypothetical protein
MLQINDAWWETSLEFLSIFWRDRRGDVDMRKETVGGGGYIDYPLARRERDFSSEMINVPTGENLA